MHTKGGIPPPEHLGRHFYLIMIVCIFGMRPRSLQLINNIMAIMDAELAPYPGTRGTQVFLWPRSAPLIAALRRKRGVVWSGHGSIIIINGIDWNPLGIYQMQYHW